MNNIETTAGHRDRLVVACVKDAVVRKELRRLDCVFQTVSSRRQLLSTKYEKHPSLFVLHVPSGEAKSALETVTAVRHQRPLADVLIWAPKATGTSVRAFFRAGARDVIVSQITASLIDSIRQTLDEQQLLPRVNDLSGQRRTSPRFESMLSRSEAMWDLFDLCSRIAPTEATALIVGETGTGKELLARAIHRRSKRAGRFVAANCASIPPELINSELFGHEKGAFTGADRVKQGLVTYAHQGTLFLDEIGDMPPEGQQSLLRMLQEMRIRPVGSLVETKIDVRVVAATNVPLDQAVRDGDFREDLFYRLDVIRMNVPPLRERREDILFLFGHFVKRLSKDYGVKVPVYADSFLDALTEFAWPGNVRQLENFSERLVLARPARALTSRDFSRLRSTSLADSANIDEQQPDRIRQWQIDPSKPLRDNIEPAVNSLERAYLRLVLAENNGRISDTAARAGISRRTLLRKLKQNQIDKRSFKNT